MATAPRPGTTRRPPGTRIDVTWQGRTLSFLRNDIGPQDNLICRQQAQMPFGAFFDADYLDTDSFGIAWWFARRKNGEPGLRLARVWAELGNDREISEAIDAGLAKLRFASEDEPPEDGPAEEGEGEDEHPLPSDGA